jgi:hypothetical protein
VKAYHDQAVAAGIPALTTAGIYPGTSNVMAAHIVSISRGEYDESWNYKQPTPGELKCRDCCIVLSCWSDAMCQSAGTE